MPKRRFLRLDARQRAKLKDRLKAGDSVSALAKEFGVSRRTIYNYKLRLAESELYYRSAVLTVRLNKADFVALDELAKRHGLSRAETARRVLLRAVDVYVQPEETSQAIYDLTQQLLPIGRNLNQIAAALNAAAKRGTLRLDKETQAALSRVRSRADAVERLADDVRHVMVGLARLQRATNERIFAELAAPERPAETPEAPERPAETPEAPERPTESPSPSTRFALGAFRVPQGRR
ncbi:helix-turn-helix domain-containing protein [Paracoccus binzhouensis]|uniref:helix-turn-helix domain-containing protein n=1 Tax=Paracoccus binzhouensis TaxID=2796149 RepID=UPI0018EEF5ED|nr:helix-turn-helix domain-containing protein [Paracoccus binzhouensis]